MHLELRTVNAEETRELGEAIAGLLRPGDAIALTGDLGAGKTTLVQGAARALGVRDQVVSPTFTLVREYEGRISVAHVDVYRLERIQDVIDLGLEELPAEPGVLFVEWGDAVAALLPDDRLEIELTGPDPGSDARRIRIIPRGSSWRGRAERLEGALARWSPAA